MIRDDAPPPPELPDVWDGAELEEASPETAQAGLEEIYAARQVEPAPEVAPGQAAADLPPPTPKHVAEEEPYSPILMLTSHVVIPAATIAMVTALLFFLYDVRAVFLPGGVALKWVGFCFAVATVLIARYARLTADLGMTKVYTLALAIATILTLWAAPWDAPGVGAAGAFSNAAIILIVWRYASKLTERLSADLDVPPPMPPRLYGLERLEMEAFKKQQRENRASIYDIGRRRAAQRDTWRADGDAATRQIVVLVLVALAGVALAEPILLAGAPELAGRALGALVVFLFAAGVVISAAASIRDQQRLRSLGALPGTGSLSARLALGAFIAAAMLTSMLAIPGFEAPEGSGAIEQRRASDVAEVDRGGDESQEPSPDGSEERVEDPNKDDPLVDQRQPRTTPTWVESLAGLGRWLRWPVMAVVALAGLVALWRFGPAFLQGLRGSLGGLFARLRRRLAREKKPKKRDPFAGLGELDRLEPREAVLEAYTIWLDACAQLGHARQERQTALEFLAAVPRHLSDLRPIGERLTRLYVAAAYATRDIDSAAAGAAGQAVRELQQTATVIERRAA